MTDKNNLLNMLDDIEAAIEAESSEWSDDEKGVELAGDAELTAPAEAVAGPPLETKAAEASADTDDAPVVVLRPELPDFDFERRHKPERMRRFEGLPRTTLSTRAFVASVAWNG